MALPINGTPLSSEELLEAQSHVWNHMFGFINPMSLKCAIELGIPDIIHKHGKPMSLSDLVDALPINKAKSHGIYRLMRILVHSKFFVRVVLDDVKEKEEEKEGYWLTPASRLLLSDDPLSMVAFKLAPTMVNLWVHIAEWFQNDDVSAILTAQGMNLYELGSNDPTHNHFFNEIMERDSRLVSGILLKDCRQVFEGLKSMVDVGGGTGTVAKAVADAFPEMRCVVLELPHVVAGLEGTRENLTFVGGDMFEFIPPADALFLKSILHNWKDEECVQILRKCKEAIFSSGAGEGRGKVMIVDIVLDIDEKNGNDVKTEKQTQLLFDMQMMALFGTGQRTEKEWAKLFLDAGFANYNITPALGFRSLIEVFP